MKNIHYGFTMIEMLIVITIISILTALSLFGLQNSREMGRDAARKGDLQAIATALEIYRSDCHEYPATLPAPTNSLKSNCTGVLLTYMEEIPSDPLGSVAYSYNRLSGNVRYALCSTLEEPPTPANDITNCNPCNGGLCGYRVTNP